ncbi:MAG: hypothetical protein ACFE0Q_10480 [Anaerolineae bacterium]
MNIIEITRHDDLTTLAQVNASFACLLSEDCPCEMHQLQKSGDCAGVAIVGHCSKRARRKILTEYALSQSYGCPVRLFDDAQQARQWLSARLNAR